MKLKLLSIILILTLLPLTGAAATNEEVNVFIDNYNLSTQNNTLELACQIGHDAANAGMNCDIYTVHFSNHKDVFIVTLYPEATNKKGYTARYFWLAPQKKEVLDFTHGVMTYQDFCEEYSGCRIKGVTGYEMVKSYFGNSSFEEQVEISNNTTQVVENLTKDVCDAVNTTYELANQTKEVQPDVVEIKMKNSTSQNEVGISANITKQESFDKDSFFESLKRMFDSIF